MTFDLTPEQQALVSTAKDVTSLPAQAADAVVVIEARAAADAAEAARFGFEALGGQSTVKAVAMPGLEGSESALSSIPEANWLRAKLIAAAVALGVGRAAVGHAVASMKRQGVKPGPDATVPHWAVADAATEVEAARMITYSAAQAVDRGDDGADAVTRALEFASSAALRAVDAAIRNEGASGFVKGGLLERLSRDAQTLQVILR